MPARFAGVDLVLARYRELLDRMDDAARDPCGSCHACCGPLSLLPIEAHALLATGLLDDRQTARAACPLLDERSCRAEDARPFACRARSLAVLHLDTQGDWSTEGCELAGREGRRQDRVAPLAEWAALLFHLDREFRGSAGLRAGRIGLAELCRAPGRYRALLSVPAGLSLASRVAT